MIAVELKGLASRKLRTVLTMIAIILGVSMISGTYILTDTINGSFDQIFHQATRKIDAVITPKPAVSADFVGTPTLPAGLLPVVRGVPGVAAADGEIADQASLFAGHGRMINGRFHGHLRRVGATGGAPSLLFGVGSERFNELTLVAGHWPVGNQVALDESTMSRSHLHLGQMVEVASLARPLEPFRIVAKTRFGSVGSIGGAALIDMDLATAQRVTGKIGEYDQISVISAPGTSQKLIARRIRSHLPAADRSTVRVRTGEQQAKSQAAQVANALNFLTIGLLAFGGIAVFVGAFIIFNTFSITVAQRAREFALLRTLGSTRGQIMRSVVIEALLIGIAASVLGTLAGLGIAKLLNGLFQTFGANLPNSGLVVLSRTVSVSLMVGTAVTVISGLMPAFRATRVPPIAAMREGVPLPKGRLSRLTPYVAGLITLLGLLLTILGIFASISSTGSRLAIIGVGCVLLFIGVAMLSPKLVTPLASAFGWPLQRATAITGRLARDNAMRSPSRTAVTAAALMIGLALVAFVTIFAAELKKTADDAVSRDVAGTFIVQNNQSFGNSVQPGVAAVVSRMRGVAIASPIRRDVAKIRGVGTTAIDGIDPGVFATLYRFQWKVGSSRVVPGLGSNGALVADAYAGSHHLHDGSPLSMLTPIGTRDTFTVRGIFKSSQILDNVLIPNASLVRDFHEANSEWVVVQAAAGVNTGRLEHRIARVLAASYPTLSVNSQQQFKSQQDSQVNSLLGLVYVLLGLSIVVSLFGIINTLVLSIYERTREIGMLRAIGTTRTQVRWMVRWESVITSLIGAVLGILLGILLAVLITVGLASQGIEFALPIGQLIVWVVLAVIFGIVAAAFPARRAARLDVLRALAYE